jgi:hypothetical protein
MISDLRLAVGQSVERNDDEPSCILGNFPPTEVIFKYV